MKAVRTLLLIGLSTIMAGCGAAGAPSTATTAPNPTAMRPTAIVMVEPTATVPDTVYVQDTPTAMPTVSAAEAPTATIVAQLQATVVAGIRPTPTVDASGQVGFGGIEGVSTFQLKNAPGDDALWVVHTKGNRSFDEPVQTHFVAVYAHNKGGWTQRSRIELENADYLDESGVEQVEIEPTHKWLMVESGAGAHSGVFDLLSFDGKTLKSEVSGANTSPGAGAVADLDGDGVLDVILNTSDNYVFCYACGVRLRQFDVLRWDGAKFVKVSLEKLPSDTPADIREANNLAVDLFNHGLMKDALPEIEYAATQARENKTVQWNQILVKLHADARQEHVGESGYPLLTNVFYGDYNAALDIMRPSKPEEIFNATSALIVDTPAEGSLDQLTEWMTSTTTLALEAKPELAGAYFLRGWAQYIHDVKNPGALADIEKAAVLDPNDKLFQESLAYLKK